MYSVTSIVELARFAIENGCIFHKNWVRSPETLDIKYMPRKLALQSMDKITEFLNQLPSDSSWDAHPLWQTKLSVDSSFNALSRFVPNVLPAEMTYKDYAMARMRNHLHDVILKLSKCEDRETVKDRFKDEVGMMDRLNQTQFLELYPEFKPYW